MEPGQGVAGAPERRRHGYHRRADAERGRPTARLQADLRHGGPLDDPDRPVYAQIDRSDAAHAGKVHNDSGSRHTHRQQRHDVQHAVRDHETTADEGDARTDPDSWPQLRRPGQAHKPAGSAQAVRRNVQGTGLRGTPAGGHDGALQRLDAK